MTMLKTNIPPTAAAISALIGNRLAMALMAHVNSNACGDLYVPLRAKPTSALVQLIGQAAAEKLCAAYGGRTISIPQCDALRRSVRDADICRMAAEGTTQTEIARHFEMTDRQVRNILKASGVQPMKTEKTEATGVRYIRARQLLQQYVPFSEATLRRKVAAGEFPQPVKLSTRVVAWKLDDVIAWGLRHDKAAQANPETVAEPATVSASKPSAVGGRVFELWESVKNEKGTVTHASAPGVVMPYSAWQFARLLAAEYGASKSA